MASLMVVVPTTVTTEPESVAVACLVHSRPRVALPFWLRSSVQPDGLPSVPLREFVVMKRTIVSPAEMPPGNVRLWLMRLPEELEAATNDKVGSAADAA